MNREYATASCEGFVLSAARWDPPLYGDERSQVPVGGLRFAVAGIPESQVEEYARFLAITPEQLVARIRRGHEENRLATARARRRHPEPRSHQVRMEYVDRPVELIAPIVEGRGLSGGGSGSWRGRCDGLTTSLTLRPDTKGRRLSTEYLLSLVLHISWRGGYFRQVNSLCHDSSYQAQLAVGGERLRWECGMCEVNDDLAERAFVVSVQNLMTLYDWIAEAPAARLEYLALQTRRSVAFNSEMWARRQQVDGEL